MGFGREGTICESIKLVMQIPPRFERRSGAYKWIAADLQVAGA
jgi:hypothetical protein